MSGCEITLREVAPRMWAGSAASIPYVGADAWIKAPRDGTLKPVLGWYAVCDEHGTADPSTHGTEAAARRWTCPPRAAAVAPLPGRPAPRRQMEGQVDMALDRNELLRSELLQSFDHSKLAELPSYHALRSALNDLANETNGTMSITEFLCGLRDMGMTACYGDHCDRCFWNGTPSPTRWPCRISRDAHGLLAYYLCGECGHRWTCGWSVTPWLAGCE